MLTYSFPKELSGASYFGSTGPYLYRLQTLLLLTGHGVVTMNGRAIKLCNDFMGVPVRQSGGFKISELVEKIPGCTNGQFRLLLRNAATKNLVIHQNIATEAMHCIAHYESGSFIASFVHLYRLIEHAALYLPLISVVTKGVNGNTFTQYKEVIDNKARSDLSILKNFSLKILDQNLGASVARFSFSGTLKPGSNFQLMRRLVGKDQVFNLGADYVEIQYRITDRLIVEFRNQFFHYLYHERNISLQDLDDPNEFLQVCMPHFISYFSFLFRELLIAEWELWA